MDDLIDRLRDTGCDREPFTAEHVNCKCRLASAAANEIERVRAERDALRMDVVAALAEVGVSIKSEVPTSGVLAMKAAYEVTRLRKAATDAVKIIDTNLYHQREKVVDAASILRQALAPI